MKKIGFVSLGCPKNLVDTEVMLGHLARAGYEPTSEPSEAEVLVVNTCGFIDRAKQESIDTILEMARHKQEGCCRRLIVAGCLAQRYADEIAREIPEVDAVVGLDQLDSIVSAAEGEDRQIPKLQADGSVVYLYDHLAPRVLTTPRPLRVCEDLGRLPTTLAPSASFRRYGGTIEAGRRSRFSPRRSPS